MSIDIETLKNDLKAFAEIKRRLADIQDALLRDIQIANLLDLAAHTTDRNKNSYSDIIHDIRTKTDTAAIDSTELLRTIDTRIRILEERIAELEFSEDENTEETSKDDDDDWQYGPSDDGSTFTIPGRKTALEGTQGITHGDGVVYDGIKISPKEEKTPSQNEKQTSQTVNSRFTQAEIRNYEDHLIINSDTGRYSEKEAKGALDALMGMVCDETKVNFIKDIIYAAHMYTVDHKSWPEFEKVLEKEAWDKGTKSADVISEIKLSTKVYFEDVAMYVIAFLRNDSAFPYRDLYDEKYSHLVKREKPTV